jgi:hypothetical protein
VTNTLALTALNVDDSQDAIGRSVVLNTILQVGIHEWGTITGIAPGVINYLAYDIKDATIQCGTGGNTVTVNSTPLKTVGQNLPYAINLNTGTGVDHVAITAISPGTTLNVDGQNGNEVVTVGFNGSVQDIAGTVTLRNAHGLDA